MNKPTITINNTVYDKHTGMPIRDERTTHTIAAKPRQTASSLHTSQAVHKRIRRSKTLDRRYVKKSKPSPATVATPELIRVPIQTAPARKATTPHPAVQKFAPHPADIVQPRRARQATADIQPTHHPLAAKAHSAQTNRTATASPAPVAPKPSQMIKREAEAKALSEATTSNKRHRNKAKRKQSKPTRFLSFATAGASLLMLGGYFTYINMPNLSVRVAAVQAGIEAEYPSYRPTGYSLSGPIAYDNGSVGMKFAMNGSIDQSFTLKQARSGWDSSAVLDSYVQPQVGDSYATTQDNGLTIYSFDANAAWVNNGILYTIEGDAPLSLEQIRKIATSM